MYPYYGQAGGRAIQPSQAKHQVHREHRQVLPKRSSDRFGMSSRKLDNLPRPQARKYPARTGRSHKAGRLRPLQRKHKT